MPVKLRWISFHDRCILWRCCNRLNTMSDMSSISYSRSFIFHCFRLNPIFIKRVKHWQLSEEENYYDVGINESNWSICDFVFHERHKLQFISCNYHFDIFNEHLNSSKSLQHLPSKNYRYFFRFHERRKNCFCCKKY